MKMRVFVGGPANLVHRRLVKVTTRQKFNRVILDAKAFDDRAPKAALDDARTWLGWLRTCDIAIFYMSRKSGSKGKNGKYFTQVEIERAVRSGIYVAFIRAGKRLTNLEKAVKQALEKYGYNYNPIEVAQGKPPSDDDVCKAFRKSLVDAVDHWKSIVERFNDMTNQLRQLINGKGATAAFDPEVEARKARIHPKNLPGRAIGEFIATCWSFRRTLPEHPEIPRYLLQGLRAGLQPCRRPHEDNVFSASQEDLWDILAKAVLAKNSRGVPSLSKSTFLCLSDWRQIAMVTLIRHMAVAFRNRPRPQVDIDWALCSRAADLYNLRGSMIDPDESLLFELAIAAVPAAIHTSKLDFFNKQTGKWMLDILQRQYDKEQNSGAAACLGMYHAACGKLEQAMKLFHDSAQGHRKSNLKAAIHSRILSGLCQTGSDRGTVLESCNDEARNNNITLDPVYRVMSEKALANKYIQWKEIVDSLRNQAPKRGNGQSGS